MRRYPDWPQRLDAAIEAARERPFSWGEHNCALFAAEVAEAISGRDFTSRWRSDYVAVLNDLRTHGGLVNFTTKMLGDPIPTAQALRGDVVLRCAERGPSLGICLGVRCAFTSFAGLVFVALKECEQAWHV